MIDFRIVDAALPTPGVSPAFVKLYFTLQIGDVEDGTYTPRFEVPSFQVREMSGDLYAANPQRPRLQKTNEPGVYRVAKQPNSEKDQYDNTFNFIYNRSGDKPTLEKVSVADKQLILELALKTYEGLVAEKGGVGVTEPEATEPVVLDGTACPQCGGKMWDNRIGKKNPKAPDFKCRDRSCSGVIWPPRNAAPRSAPPPVAVGATETEGGEVGLPGQIEDDLPFR